MKMATKCKYLRKKYNVHWDHIFADANHSFWSGGMAEIEAWCIENLGSPAKQFDIEDGGRWIYLGLGEFAVRADVDACAFRLRWC